MEKLFASEKFQDFMKENPSAYFCSGFFSIDKESKGNKIHIDYMIPETKKIFSFQLEGEVGVVPVEQSENNVLERLVDNLDFSLEEIEKMIEKRMEKEDIKHKIQKILLSLQKIEGKVFLVGTIFISGLGMIRIKINLDNMVIEEFEKKSFMDMLKIVKK